MFKVNMNADINGTSLKGYISASYAELVRAFGEPHESDGYKVSGEWSFEGEDGSVFTIYDWKKTNLYEPDYESVNTFRSNPNRVTFNVGGRESAINFISWVNQMLEKVRAK